MLTIHIEKQKIMKQICFCNSLNSYHGSIKLRFKISPTKVLYIKTVRIDSVVEKCHYVWTSKKTPTDNQMNYFKVCFCRFSSKISQQHKKLLRKRNRCSSNITMVIWIIKKVSNFPKNKWSFNVLLTTGKINFFSIKDKVMHYSCVIYKGICSRKKPYVKETVQNG